MRPGPLLVALAVVGSLACGAPPPSGPEGGVVLWESGAPTPRFPVPAEASWEPDYQRLFRALEPGPGEGDLVVCYGAGPFDEVVRFYAAELGAATADFELRGEPAERWFATVRRVSTRLGHRIEAPAGVTGRARHAVLPQEGDRPRVELHSPYPRAQTGERVRGTLVVLRWRPPAAAEGSP